MYRNTLVTLGVVMLANTALAQEAGVQTAGSNAYMSATLGFALSPDYDYKTDAGAKGNLSGLNNGFSGAFTGGWLLGGQSDVSYGVEAELLTLSSPTDKYIINGVTLEGALNTFAFMAGAGMTNSISDKIDLYAGANLGTAGTDMSLKLSAGTTTETYNTDAYWALAFGGKAGVVYNYSDNLGWQAGYRVLSVGETKDKDAGWTYDHRLHHIFEGGIRIKY